MVWSYYSHRNEYALTILSIIKVLSNWKIWLYSRDSETVSTSQSLRVLIFIGIKVRQCPSNHKKNVYEWCIIIESVDYREIRHYKKQNNSE